MAIKYLLLSHIEKIVNAVKSYINENVIPLIPGVATASKAGIIKPGQGLQVESDGTTKVVLDGIEVNPDNIAKATDAGYGIVKIGEGVNVSDGVISVNAYTKTEADGKFQTEAQVNAIAESKAAAKVAEVVNGAPEELDTLKEIAVYLKDETAEAGLVKQLAAKADKSTVVALSGTVDEKADAADVYSKTDADSTFIKAADLVAATDAEVESALTAAFAAA